MHRTFATTTSRRQTSLEGEWELLLDPDDVGIGQGWHRRFPTRGEPAWVPGVWNTIRAHWAYEGVAWYRTRLHVGACRAALIRFAAVTQQANVWLDGEPLGEHYGGYTPFCFLVQRPDPGEHELVVRVDNTHDMVSTIPSANLDWFRYGGITRPVWIEELDGPGHVSSLRLTPVVHEGRRLLRVRAELLNIGDAPVATEWRLSLDGRSLREDTLRLEPAGCEVLAFAAEVADAELWSPQNPRLYHARLEFGGDDLIERTGFRKLHTEGRRVFLNDEPLRLRGLNRHEDHPDWGPAIPQHLMLRDLTLAADMGINSIRGAHYPNDQRWLDLCDERGILFIAEIPLWGFSREQMAQDIIAGRAPAMLWAMVERDANHPCIWGWSVLNECATDTSEGRLLMERLVETVREADPTRLVTYASHHGAADICYDLADVVCLNAYPGWYSRELSWPGFLDEMRRHIGDKPLIVSEFGAGGIYGCHALEEGVLWSEEHQAHVLERAIHEFTERDDLAGFYIWQFCDTRSDRHERALRRPRSYNNKGLVDEFRRPKMAFHAVRRLLNNRR